MAYNRLIFNKTEKIGENYADAIWEGIENLVHIAYPLWEYNIKPTIWPNAQNQPPAQPQNQANPGFWSRCWNTVKQTASNILAPQAVSNGIIRPIAQYFFWDPVKPYVTAFIRPFTEKLMPWFFSKGGTSGGMLFRSFIPSESWFEYFHTDTSNPLKILNYANPLSWAGSAYSGLHHALSWFSDPGFFERNAYYAYRTGEMLASVLGFVVSTTAGLLKAPSYLPEIFKALCENDLHKFQKIVIDFPKQWLSDSFGEAWEVISPMIYGMAASVKVGWETAMKILGSLIELSIGATFGIWDKFCEQLGNLIAKKTGASPQFCYYATHAVLDYAAAYSLYYKWDILMQGCRTQINNIVNNPPIHPPQVFLNLFGNHHHQGPQPGQPQPQPGQPQPQPGQPQPQPGQPQPQPGQPQPQPGQPQPQPGPRPN